jgi:hypothetical protein
VAWRGTGALFNLTPTMRNQLLLVCLILSGLHFQGNRGGVAKWVIVNGCSLKVDGSTNINTFSCIIGEYSHPDTISISRSPGQPVPMSGMIMLDIQKFDCHNLVMTADLRKTLKSKEFPHLIIRFLSMSKYPDLANRQEATKGMVAIELAGVSKRFEVDYKVQSAGGNFISLVGSRRIQFSDFFLSPPRKLGGMIRTDNNLSVVFNLRMKVLE